MRSARTAALALALAVALPLIGGGCSKKGSTEETPPGAPPKPPAHDNPAPEALERKARSEARLKTEGVPMSTTLPVIATEAEARLRARDAVVDRAIALMLVATKAEGLEQEHVVRNRERFGAATFFSPKEKLFIENLNPGTGDKATFGWRYECLGVMLWALGLDPDLPRPNKIVDAGRIVKLLLDKGPKTFRSEAKLRSPKELLDAADLVYRYDWACVDARVTRKPPPSAIDCEVVVERHHALNWLIGYQGQEWDDVSTDT